MNSKYAFFLTNFDCFIILIFGVYVIESVAKVVNSSDDTPNVLFISLAKCFALVFFQIVFKNRITQHNKSRNKRHLS